MASILTNTAIAASGRVISAALGILSIGLITRLLGADQFGNYTLIISVATILQIAADGGLYLTLTREIAAYPEKERSILEHTLSLRLVLLALLFGSGAIAITAIPQLRGLWRGYSIAIAALTFQSLSQLALGVYQKYGVVWRATFGDIVGRIAQIAGLAIASIKGATLETVMAIFAGSTAVTAVLHRQMLPALSSLKPKISLKEWQTIMQASWPLATLLILNVVYFRTDTVILALFRTPTEVGLYGIAYRLIESGLFFPAMFGGIMLPHISRAWQNNDTATMRRLIQQALIVIMSGATLALVIMNTYPREIILMIAGDDFISAATLLQLLSSALAIMFFGNLFGFILVATRQQTALLKLYTILAAANLGANVIVIPHYGAVGAATTTIATEGIATTVAAIMVWQKTRYRVEAKVMLKCGIAGGITAGVLALLPRWQTLINIVIAGIVFSALGVVLGLMRRENLNTLIQKPPQ